ncbi:outer membrane protein assembly factor BamB family protein [Haladaptatus caseinilyticus]|uniref:outer membrane protein assembly factor BamB family protein n=1 Tax=Haladaptatus caseinilyticus TaxID=2993314 RepID=UPI00224AB73A|nr:PQQ-binding-like beta-propeller repeat protein [Haladaptatus caseinilyticus]
MNRKRARIGVLLALLVVISSVSFVTATTPQSPAPANNDWSSDRADSGRTGATNDAGPSPYAAEDWNTSFDARAESVPAVADGTAYVSVTTNVELPATGRIIAYDTEAGEERWTSSKVGAARGSPAVADGVVYVATRGTSADGYENYGGLHALDAETGDVEWRVKNAPDGSPIVADDTVYVGGTAYNAETGEELWTAPGEIIGVVDGTAYAKNDTSVMSLDAEDGTPKWNAQMPATAESYAVDSAVTSDRIYLTVETDRETQPIYALSTEDGTVEWNRSVPRAETHERDLISEPAVKDGSVYVSTRGNDSGTVYSLDAETGDEQWTYDTSADHLSAPTVSDGTVYVGGRFFTKLADTDDIVRPAAPAVYAIDASNGEERWNYSIREAGSLVAYAPVVDDGKAYVTVREWNGIFSDESELFAFESSDEKPPVNHQVAENKPEDPSVAIETSPEDAEERTFEENRTVVLRANASTAENDEIVRYEWDIDGDGEYEKTGNEIEIHTDFCGERTITVRVVDDDKLTADDSVTLTRR